MSTKQALLTLSITLDNFQEVLEINLKVKMEGLLRDF